MEDLLYAPMPTMAYWASPLGASDTEDDQFAPPPPSGSHCAPPDDVQIMRDMCARMGNQLGALMSDLAAMQSALDAMTRARARSPVPESPPHLIDWNEEEEAPAWSPATPPAEPEEILPPPPSRLAADEDASELPDARADVNRSSCVMRRPGLRVRSVPSGSIRARLADTHYDDED